MNTTHISKIFAVLIALAIVSGVLTGCRDQEDDPDYPVIDVAASTPDEAAEHPAVVLDLEEPDFDNVELAPDTNWQSLYFEYIRWAGDYESGALMYVNDDEIPELYLRSDSDEISDRFCFVTEDGVSVDTVSVDASEGFWYIEKQSKILIHDIQSSSYTDAADSESPTELHEETVRDATLYYFTGDQLNYDHVFRRRVVDGYVDQTGEEDDGAYDYDNGEETIPIYDVYTAVRDYIDTMWAKTPMIVSLDTIIEDLKTGDNDLTHRAAPYDGDPRELVSTYAEASMVSSLTDYEKNEPLQIAYRVPQLDIESENAAAVNREILDLFSDDLDVINSTASSSDSDDYSYPTRFKKVDYQAYGDHGVLSLVIDCTGYGGTDSLDEKYVYSFEAATGKRLQNPCLLRSYGYDPESVSIAFRDQVRADYDAIRNDPEQPINQSEVGMDDAAWDDLYTGTIGQYSPVGKINRMYVDDAGNVNILYLYKWVAGSGYYLKTMTLSADQLPNFLSDIIE